MGAMRYMPHALHNLLRAMPMPWEAIRYVDVLYHVSGLITFVTEKRRVDAEEYKRRWGCVSARVSREARRRGTIRVLRYPVFDDEDEAVDYERIIGMPIPKAIDGDGECFDVFGDADEGYLFNCRAFSISKHVGVQIDGGPHVLKAPEGAVAVMEREAGGERVAYPYLYNRSTRVARLERIHLGLRSSFWGEGVGSARSRRARHPVDIPLLKGRCLRERAEGEVRVGSLLRKYTRNSEKRTSRKAASNILKELKNTRYFQRTEVDWVEAGLQVVCQGHRMLSEVLRRKKLSYLVLDWNFNLKPLRQLTTKERKRSRVGTSYHLTREMLKFVKHVVDTHVLFRQGDIDAYELVTNVGHVLNNVGIVTGIYRYKYRLMRQIKQCKAWRRLCLEAGTCVWAEQWRTWCFMLRGHIPLLGRYIGGLVARIAEGREYKAKPLSKQRSESGYDVALKRRIVEEASAVLHPSQVRRLLQHFGEAWRCWKANVPYHLVDEQIKGMELRGTAPLSLGQGGLRAAGEVTAASQEAVALARSGKGNVSISSEQSLLVFSSEFVSELEERARAAGVKHREELFELQGVIDRYVRLKSEWYVESAVGGEEKARKMEKKRLGKITRLYMKERMAEQVDYLKRPFLGPAEAVAVYRLAAEYFGSKGVGKIQFPEKNEERFLSIAVERLKRSATVEECEFFDKALEESADTIFRIKKAVLTQRSFKEVEVTLKRYGDGGVECYHVSYMERLVDAFVCAYLFYESDRLNVFPEFIKPGDEMDIRTVMRFCEKVSSFAGSEDEGLVLYEGRYEGIMRMVDNNLLSKLLKLVLEPTLADYIISRNNCRVVYKDMSYTNHVGFLRGFQLSAFVYKLYSFVIDLCVLGEDVFMDERSSIKWYFRHMDDVYILLRLGREEERLLLDDYASDGERIKEAMKERKGNYFDSVKERGFEEPWLNDLASERGLREKTLEGCIHAEIATRLLPCLGRVRFRGCSVFPTIRFSMCGIDVLISDKKLHEKSSWKLRNGMHANLAVCSEGMRMFESNIAHIVGTSGSATFLKVATRWNTQILAFTVYYRECIWDTKGVIERLRKAEGQIQNVVKRGMNSKMPVRFPAVLFYAPKEMGGLGMLSAGGIKACGEDGGEIPAVMDYVDRWEWEFEESDRVWAEYGRSGKVEVDKGVPRMSTLLQRNKTLVYDRGFRMIGMFRRHQSTKPDWFWFTDTRHDGKLWGVERLGADVLQVLGGACGIADHTLFGATYFRSFNKVFWEEASADRYRRLTNAQKMGLSKVPNRRFMLWWSPTINRGNVYVGYQVQLDQTRILMHGKLPTLKISFVQIFRNHLWKRIHEGVVSDLCEAFGRHCEARRLEVHRKKSYRLGSSCADILLSGDFSVHGAASIGDEGSGECDEVGCKELWVDVQLRWGDYDKRDTHRYAKTRFAECAADPQTRYPAGSGFVVALDLCYNTWSGYGNFNEEIKAVLRSSMATIVGENAMLHILRERLRKALQLYTSDVEVVSNGAELFSSGLLVDTRVLLRKEKALFVLDPASGNLYFKSYHGEGKKIRQTKLLAAKDVFLLGEELKKRSVVVSEDMVDAMENFVIDHASVAVKTCSSVPPLSNVMRLETLRIEKAVGHVGLYEGWGETSRFTNFCRLLLVMQGLEADEDRVKGLGICKVWPDLVDSEWIRKEIELKDIVVGKYCDAHGMDSSSLSQSEVRDIVFGFKVSSGSACPGEVVDTGLTSGVGKINRVESISFGGSDGWRKGYARLDRMTRDGKIEKWISDVLSRVDGKGGDGELAPGSVQIPLNLVGEFMRLAAPENLVFGLVLGEDPVSFGLVPQFSSVSGIHSSRFVPEADVIGVVMNGDAIEIASGLCERYQIESPFVVMIGEEIRMMKKTSEWEEVRVSLDKRPGVFYVPEMWNYSFARPFYNDELEYTWRVGTPRGFYDGGHRAGHFSKFWKGGETDADVDEY